MRKIIFIISLYFFSHNMWAQIDSLNLPKPVEEPAIDTTTYVYAGVMYEKGDYQTAAEIYERLLTTNGESPEIYYNLGNAYYKLNKFGPAILNYERALVFSPTDDDIRYNLDIANLKIRDRIEPVSENILLAWWRNFIVLLPIQTWAFLTIALLWMSFTGFIFYRVSNNYSTQRLSFYLFAIALIIFIISATATFSRNDYDLNYRFAIVMSPSTIVKSEPNESSTNLYLVHEGLKIRLMDTEGTWSEIKMPDGNVGWVKTEDLEGVNVPMK